MEYLAHINLQGSNTDLIVDRFKDVIYNYPNVDISSFANKHNAKLHTGLFSKCNMHMDKNILVYYIYFTRRNGTIRCYVP